MLTYTQTTELAIVCLMNLGILEELADQLSPEQVNAVQTVANDCMDNPLIDMSFPEIVQFMLNQHWELKQQENLQ